MKYVGVIFILFMNISVLLSQDTTGHAELLKRANENIGLIRKNPEIEILNAKNIERQAREEDVPEAELLAIVTQCIYYKAEIDFQDLMATSRILFDRAKAYKMPNFQAIGKYYTFEAYLFNGLPEKGFEQLEEGVKYVNQAEKEGINVSGIRVNFYVAYSNYFLEQKDFENQLKYIKLSGDEIMKMPDSEGKFQQMYLHYSNLAQVYNEMNEVDSAVYYANLSIATDKGYHNANAQFMNLLILGQAGMKSGDYQKALTFFRKAEKIEGSKNHINVLNLYNYMITSYQKLQRTDSARIYQYKKDELRLNISENQNKLLHSLLNGVDTKVYPKYLYSILFILLAAGVVLFIIIRKNRIIDSQERNSVQYLQNNQIIAESHIRLIELVKENSPAFITYFDEIYPDFSRELLKINPKLTSSEIEFCAILKLGIPTKDIAKYKFIAPKTVQNKKYLIRKKLNIPKEVDTYQWFDQF